MEKIRIKQSDLIDDKYLGVGAEGAVYPYNDNGRDIAIKKFFDLSNLNNKLNKIAQLEKLKNKDGLLVLPQKLVELDGNIIGYTMDRYNILTDSEKIFYSNRKDRIDFLRKTKSIVQLLNENKILYFDYDNGNVVVDTDGNYHLIDLDNASFNGMPFDKVSNVARIARKRNIPQDESFNKYCFNIFTFALLSKRMLLFVMNDIEGQTLESDLRSKEAKLILNYTNKARNEYRTDYVIDKIKR